MKVACMLPGTDVVRAGAVRITTRDVVDAKWRRRVHLWLPSGRGADLSRRTPGGDILIQLP